MPNAGGTHASSASSAGMQASGSCPNASALSGSCPCAALAHRVGLLAGGGLLLGLAQLLDQRQGLALEAALEPARTTGAAAGGRPARGLGGIEVPVRRPWRWWTSCRPTACAGRDCGREHEGRLRCGRAGTTCWGLAAERRRAGHRRSTEPIAVTEPQCRSKSYSAIEDTPPAAAFLRVLQLATTA